MSSIVSGIVRALLGGLLDYLEQRRQEAALVRLGKLEEKADAEAANARVRLAVRDIEFRLANDPEYALRMRERSTRLAGS